ncbi:hypothetical protein VTJ04DRAFT_8485 [Mycothermus thermophilus]|uniref:uncharacterized protein n=1 Tax=Humicola insolens TaxID=85995 RepID=UPI0037446942
MGIKGIYKEIGPGNRISLCKLAIDTLEQTGRPFRLAIDFSIWQFQVQAARGGSNPAIRTLFYRLVRLLGLAIHPIFVFDGPHKPAFKRNKRSAPRADSVSTTMAKRLIRLFGFAIHDAPGEAEAECALLEQQGIVDAVLSEDVDTIMFGCRRTLRNWTAEGKTGPPTHVSMYDAAEVAAGPSGLDREGMVLVALMSGGDYLPEGVPGCGPKIACEAAKAGFGRDLCRLKRADAEGLAAWRQRLLHELRTNESGFFRTRHRGLEIPDSFPNMEILRYYTHPVVSRESTVERLRKEFPRPVEVDILGLREFCRETFDWSYKNGAVKFIRVLASGLLVQRLVDRYQSAERESDDIELMEKQEAALVKGITGRRAHFSTDATPELRISFIPVDIVKLDLDSEPEEEEAEGYGRSGIALNSDDDFEGAADEEGGGDRGKVSAKKPFDPFQPELVWIPETLAKLGIPLTVEDWEAKQRAKELRTASKGAKKGRPKTQGMPAGALDKFVKVTKKGSEADTSKIAEEAPTLPATSLHPDPPAPVPAAKGRSKQSKKTATSSQNKAPVGVNVNPWTLAGSQTSPKVTKPVPSSSSQSKPKPSSSWDPIILSSSPVAPHSPPEIHDSVNLNEGKLTATTPTKPTRAKEPESSPSSKPSTKPIPEMAKRSSCGSSESKKVTSKQPSRSSRPFKRVKSGAEDSSTISTTQRPITDFARLTKTSTESSKSSNIPSSYATEPIEILSDSDDEFPDLLAPKSKLPDQTKPAPPSGKPVGGGIRGLQLDDDPFTDAGLAKPPTAKVEVGAVDRSDLEPKQSRNETQGQEQPSSVPRRHIDDDDWDKDINLPHTSSSTKPMTKLLISSKGLSDEGFFTQIEVPRDKADAILASYNGPNGSKPEAKKKAYRLSEITVVDLTGDDSTIVF